MTWDDVYEAFPVNREMIWLNNCGTVPAGTHAANRVSEFVEGYSQKGLYTETASFEGTRNAIKSILANLLNCKPGELALIHHTAEGMNFISHGLKLTPGDEIILLENEFPSNYYPWLHWRDKDVVLKTTPMGEDPGDFLENLKKQVTEKTRAITISSVHWCTGMPLPLKDVGMLCRENGIDFIVDGAQGVGLLPHDLKGQGVSHMAFPAWKWLMGPLGMGVLYISEEKIGELNPIFVGTDSVVNSEEYFPYKTELKPGADRFTISTPNFADWVWFHASLEYLDGIGFENARQRILELNKRLAGGLRASGFQVYSDKFPDSPTGITVCEKKGIPARELVAHLKKNKIIVAERLGRVRLAPHIYISPDQIDETIRVMSAFR